MWQLLQIELFKIFRKPRTYISFGAIAVMVIIVQIALKFDGQSYIEFIVGSLKGIARNSLYTYPEWIFCLFCNTEFIADSYSPAYCTGRGRFRCR